MNNNIQSKLLL